MPARAPTASRRSRRSSRRRSLPTHLGELETAQLIYAVADPEPTYSFKHALTHDAAYDSLLVKHRRQIHRLVAEAYEQLYAARCMDEFAAALAHHYGEAGDDDKFIVYGTHAADLAAARFAHAEAIDLYVHVLARARARGDLPAQLLTLYTHLGRTFELAGRWDAARDLYLELQSLAEQQQDRPAALEAILRLSTVYAVGGPLVDWPQAHTTSEHALALARELGDRPAEARAYWNLLLANRFGNEGPHQAIAYGEQALQIARAQGLREQVAYVLKDICFLYYGVGRIHYGVELGREAVDLWRALDNLPMLAESLGSLALGTMILGELEQAHQFAQEAFALNRTWENHFGLTLSTMALALVAREQGELSQYAAWIEQGLTHARIASTLGWLGGGMIEHAWTLGSLGDFTGAFAMLDEARRLPLFNSPLTSPLPSAVQARLLLRQGDVPAAARALAGHDLSPFRHFMFPPSSPQVAETIYTAHAELALAQGELERAAAIADDLLNGMREYDARLHLPTLLHLRARISLAQHRPDEARQLLQEALTLAEAMGAHLRLWPLPVALMDLAAEQGRQDEQERWRERSVHEIDYLKERMPADLKRAFLALPNVQRVYAGVAGATV